MEPLYVTRTFLPPVQEYEVWMHKAYAAHVLTNNGPIHRDLEGTLRTRFEVPHLRLMANGTLALQLAIRALGIRGQVITTPYSYVATTSAILWEGCEPVFVDILPGTLCIDPQAIEAAITPATTAILATHVYGIPCEVEAIADIARRHGLKVIYDAAHAFDVTIGGRSILRWGDASTLSFHATKLFHTVEGGAVIVHHEEHDKALHLLRGFGHIGDEHFTLGINAKMSELHAAMGMAVLPHVPALIERRRAVAAAYDERLDLPGLKRPRIAHPEGHNHGYYPLLLPTGEDRERVLRGMADRGVHGRRYFYPSLSQLPYVTGRPTPVSDDAAMRALCLPMHADLVPQDIDRVVGAFLEAWRS